MRTPGPHRTRRWAALLAAAAFCATGPGAAAQPQPDGAAARGRAFAEHRCSGCHNVSADDGPPYEGPPFRLLAGRYDSQTLARRFAEVSAHGVDRMPPITFTPDEREDLLAYVRTLRAE